MIHPWLTSFHRIFDLTLEDNFLIQSKVKSSDAIGYQWRHVCHSAGCTNSIERFEFERHSNGCSRIVRSVTKSGYSFFACKAREMGGKVSATNMSFLSAAGRVMYSKCVSKLNSLLYSISNLRHNVGSMHDCPFWNPFCVCVTDSSKYFCSFILRILEYIL